MLSLSKRPCKLGNSMSTNTEKHGDEDVGAIDLALDGIMLNAPELDALLGNGAHKALYICPPPNADEAPLPEVRFAQFKPFAFKGQFEKARVALELGMDGYELTLHECKVRSLKLTPNAGGLTTLSCSIRSTPDGDAVATLYDYLNGDASVTLSGAEKAKEKAKDRQTDLALGEASDGEDDATEGAGDDEPGDAEELPEAASA